MRMIVTAVFSMLLACQPVLAAAPINSIVAVVNGDMITKYDYDKAVTSAMARAKLDRKNTSQKDVVAQLQKTVLEQMISDIVIAQEAERLKISIPEGEISAELENFKRQNKLTDAEMTTQLKKQGLTLEAFREQMQKHLLKQELLRAMVGRKVIVTKEEVATYYKEHPDMFAAGGDVTLALIVYAPSADAPAWAARLKNAPDKFADAVREVSVGPNAQSGGELGQMSWSDLAPSLRERVAELEPGMVSELFELQGMQAQVKLLSRSRGGGEQELEAVRVQIEQLLRAPKLQERYIEYMEQLRERAVIDIRM